MPKVNRQSPVTSEDTTVDYYLAYHCHGLDLRQGPGDQLIADCTFCGRDNVFYVNRTTGQWDCKTCDPNGGNLTTFLRRYWQWLSSTSIDYQPLSLSRGLLKPDTCRKWGVVLSQDGTWLVPGLNHERQLVQLYRYIRQPNGQYRLRATPAPSKDDHGRGLHQIIDAPDRSKVIITEGVWDGMLLSEAIDNQYTVVAVPGCNIFKSSWCSLFSGKQVILAFDNDYPDCNGRINALLGLERITNILATSSTPPKSISYLKWGDTNDYVDDSVPSGYDVSDHLRKSNTIEGRRKLWKGLLSKTVPVPKEWTVRKVSLLKPTATDNWKEVRLAWKKAMINWPPPGESLDYAMLVMLATILSPRTQGDLVWVKMIGPPSCGKSVLCEAISVATRYVKPISHMNAGLFSGYRTTNDDTEDNGLINDLNTKTGVVKDGDTLLQHPRLPMILAQFRDAYDGVTRTHYGNRMGKDYNNLRFSLIISGTKNISKMDRSDLGERMIDCIAVDSIEPETQREIGLGVLLRSVTQGKLTVNGSPESSLSAEIVEARKRTAGFIEYLCDDPDRVLKDIETEDILEVAPVIYDWAEFTAYMRVKMPITRKDQPAVDPQKELPFRLTSQFGRLALCLAAVLGKRSFDSVVMALVRKVVMNTCEGPTLKLANCLFPSGSQGLEQSAIAIKMGTTATETAEILRFQKELKIVTPQVTGTRSIRWRLTEPVRALYNLTINYADRS